MEFSKLIYHYLFQLNSFILDDTLGILYVGFRLVRVRTTGKKYFLNSAAPKPLKIKILLNFTHFDISKSLIRRKFINAYI